ncbi:MAG: AsmA-like C-terminal region-containing protein [Verrucomicrobiia bacterium]
MSAGANPDTTANRLMHCFRRVRLAILAAILFLVLFLLAIGKIAAPGFITAWIRSAAHAHGINLEFKRVVWRWYRGIVAEQVIIQPATNSNIFKASMEELVLDMDWSRLLTERRLDIDGIQLSQGHATLSVPANTQSTETVELNEIAARLRRRSTNAWELEELHARAFGARFDARGVLTNLAALTKHAAPKKGATNEIPAWQTRLAEFVRVSSQFELDAPPEFHLRFSGDIAQTEGFSGVLKARIPGVRGSWGRTTDSQLEIDLVPDSSPEHTPTPHVAFCSRRMETKLAAFDDLQFFASLPRIPSGPSNLDVTWQITAAGVSMPNCRLENVSATGSTRPHTAFPLTFRTSIEMRCAAIETKWFSAGSNTTTATLLHSATNAMLQEVLVESRANNVSSEHGNAAEAMLTAKLTPHRSGQLLTQDDDASAPCLAVNQIDLSIAGTGIDSARIPVTQFMCNAKWIAPELHVQHLEAQLPTGTLTVRPATLNTQNRRLTATLHSNFDPHSIEPLLSEKAQQWLQQFDWKQPPEVDASITIPLPETAGASFDWQTDLPQKAQLTATLHGSNVSYRAVPIEYAALKVSLSNEVLHLTDFSVVRPEGQAQLEYQLHTRTREFNWNVNGSLSPKEIGPAISRDAPQLLSMFDFSQPTKVVGKVWGCWKPPERIECALAVTAANFSFRGEPVDHLDAFVCSSNKILSASNVSIQTGNEWIKAPTVNLDFEIPRVCLSNAQCCIDPLKVARAIGSNVVSALEPYRFGNPPLAKVSGVITFPEHRARPDIVFDVAGGPFHFWRLNASEVAGVVHWQEDRLLITNLAASLCQGRLTGNVRAEFHQTNDTMIQFSSRLVNADLRLLARDLLEHPANIEGTVSANFNVVNGHASDVRTWSGYGDIEMRDGSLWDLPIFGILSPILNTVIPGLGNSKARSASATFTLDNSVLRTDNLAIDAGPARLRYHGKTDLEGRVDARAEAEILASTPLVGPFISLALTPLSKVFIFQVNGTLAKPELEPVYVPRLFMHLLRPFHTLRSLFPGGTESTPQQNTRPEQNNRENNAAPIQR